MLSITVNAWESDDTFWCAWQLPVGSESTWRVVDLHKLATSTLILIQISRSYANLKLTNQRRTVHLPIQTVPEGSAMKMSGRLPISLRWYVLTRRVFCRYSWQCTQFRAVRRLVSDREERERSPSHFLSKGWREFWVSHLTHCDSILRVIIYVSLTAFLYVV